MESIYIYSYNIYIYSRVTYICIYERDPVSYCSNFLCRTLFTLGRLTPGFHIQVRLDVIQPHVRLCPRGANPILVLYPSLKCSIRIFHCTFLIKISFYQPFKKKSQCNLTITESYNLKRGNS